MNKIKLIILSSWLSLTFFVDFAFIPIVFRTLKTSPYLAGEVGMKSFAIFNPIEVIFSIILCLIAIKFRKEQWIQLLLSFFLLILSLIYWQYLAPQIANLAFVMQKMEVTNSADFIKVQIEHRFFHNWYVRLDSVKIVVLIFLLILTSLKSKK